MRYCFIARANRSGVEQLVDQCLRMFANFHQRLRVIERDTVYLGE